MILFNYSKLALLGTFFAFNASFNAKCMTSDGKFNWQALPLDMQQVITAEVLKDKQLTPKRLYAKLLNFRAIAGDEAFEKFIQNLQNAPIENKKWLCSQALVYAVKSNSLEIAKALLLMGANAKTWDEQTQRPIIEHNKNQLDIFSKLLWSYNKKTQMEQLLLDHGAIENAPYAYKDEQVMDAASNGNTKLIKKLINSGANINANNGRWTALIWASFTGHLDIVKELIHAGANVNANDDGWTALMKASIRNHLDIVKELIHSGADLNVRLWYTALDLARKEGHMELVNYLEKITKKYSVE